MTGVQTCALPICSPASGIGTRLTFGGPDTDANGFAMYRNGFLLEDGTTSDKILEMHPMWVDDGVISGLYPPHSIAPGGRFKAQIGFLAKSDRSCGVGDARFQLNYKEAGVLQPINQWTDTCNGTLQNVDVDLSSLAGKTVQFALVILANGSSGQDWAVWVNVGIEY